MIIVKIIGGLGNQLFQYAFGKSIEHRTGVKVYYDLEDFNLKYKLRDVALQHFNVTINNADQSEIKKLTSIYNKALYKIYQLSNGTFIKKTDLNYYVEINSLFDREILSIKNDMYLNGYWQSEKYFSDITTLIREEFKIITPANKSNLNFIEKIKNSNAVSIHIRRGDYITNPSAKKIYNICSLDYYKSAISYIEERVNNPVFFIFSDDIQWAKSNLAIKNNLIFVEQKDSDKNYEDLRLMRNCKHNIIANSTFSWWGAWLNDNDDKIVISPENWFVNNALSTADLIPPSWIRL